MIEFSLVRSILPLKMFKYVSMALASRMICVYDMSTIFAWFGFLFSPSCSIVSNYVLYFLLLFVVVSEKQTKKTLRFGPLPLLNMPKKSHETAKPPPRSYRSVVKDLTPSSNSVYYKTFSELCQRIERLKSLSEWSYKIFSERVVVKAFGSFLVRVEDHELYLKYKRSMRNITVSMLVNELKSYKLCGGVNPTEITSKLFHHVVPLRDHELYLKYKRSMRNITVSMLVNELKSYKLCGGVNPTEITSKLFHHVVPLNQDLTGDEDSEQFPHKGYWRVKGCVLLEDSPENGGLLLAHIILSSPTMVFLC